MNAQPERRRQNRSPEDQLSPEALALIASCGGEVRRGDRAAIAGIGRRVDPRGKHSGAEEHGSFAGIDTPGGITSFLRQFTNR